jgi:large subunit ribosomal protein L20
MPRVKRGKTHLKRRKNIMAQTKGYMWGRKSKLKLAKVAILKAGKNAYRDRRLKKRDMRGLWQTRISAAVRPLGSSYSKFMGSLKKAGITVDRKILSQIAGSHPEAFKAIYEAASKQ